MKHSIVCKGVFDQDVLEKAGTDTATIDIKGFASISGDDRVDDNIDPRLFDIKTYMKNPQLWVDHDKFTKYDKDGNMIRTNIGRVKAMWVVSVKMKNNDTEFDVVDLETGEVVDSVKDASAFSVKEGIKGLWVKAIVMEPEYVNLIKQRRISAFSWQGSIIRRKSGTVKSIDLLEVSIVHTPMHPGALFTIGKSADGLKALTRAVVYEDGSITERFIPETEQLKKSADISEYLVMSTRGNANKQAYFDDEKSAKLGAMAFLESAEDALVLRSAHAKTEDGGRVYDFVVNARGNLSVQSQQKSSSEDLQNSRKGKKYADELTIVERLLLDMTVKDVSATNNTTGGGESDMTKEEMQELLNPLAKTLKDFSVRLSTLEKSMKDDDDDDDVEADTDEEAAEEATEKAKKPSGTADNCDPSMESGKGCKPKKAAKKFREQMVNLMSEVVKSVKEQSARLDALEGKTQRSKQVSDEDAGEDEEAVSKGITSEDIASMFADLAVPDEIGHRD